jgi:hypothetical protein
MVYAGGELPSVDGYDTEPALIDPVLPVDWRRPDRQGQSMGYWPSYSTISPQSRAAYLQWLAGGRCDPMIGIGYVFLFFYGLERHALAELGLNGEDAELDEIAAEVGRLLGLYGHLGSFGNYAGAFLELISVSDLGNADISPGDIASNPRTWEMPLTLRVAVARLAASGQPVSPEWALVWLRNHPAAYLRTPADRCAEEFDELFKLRYRDEHPDGMPLTKTKQRIELDYRPASNGFGGRIEATLGELPDVAWEETNVDRLREVASQCADALDSYSRYLGKNPDGRGSPDAVGLLPQALLRSHGGSTVRDLETWLDSTVSDDFTVVDIDDLIAVWSPESNAEKLASRRQWRWHHSWRSSTTASSPTYASARPSQSTARRRSYFAFPQGRQLRRHRSTEMPASSFACQVFLPPPTET